MCTQVQVLEVARRESWVSRNWLCKPPAIGAGSQLWSSERVAGLLSHLLFSPLDMLSLA